MFAFAHDKIINVSSDFAEAMCGVSSGYKVVLHDLPQWTFHVAADTTDKAQAMVFEIARKENRAKSDAATIQKLYRGA